MGGPGDDSALVSVLVSVDRATWVDVAPTIRSVEIEDHDALTDEAKIILDDSTRMLAEASFEGFYVRVALGWVSRPETIFEGVIVSALIKAVPGGQQVELTARDFTHLMTLETMKPGEWKPGEPLSAVLQRIIGRTKPLTVGKIQPGTDPKMDAHRPVGQAGVNEWEFVLDQARRQSCLAFAEFDGKSESKFYFVPIKTVAAQKPIGTLKYCLGSGDLVEFGYERISSGVLPARAGATIDPASGKVVEQPAAPPKPRPDLPPPASGRHRQVDPAQRDAVKALAQLGAAANAKLLAPKETVSGAIAGTAADLAAAVEPDPTRVLGMSGHGVATGNTLLRAKSMVTILGVAPWAEGDWYLTKVNHVFTRERSGSRTRSSYATKFTATR